MNYLLRKLLEIKAYFILRILCRILFKYVERQRMWYNPVNKFVAGDKVALNWKFIVAYSTWKPMEYWKLDIWTFYKIDDDNVVDTLEGEVYNLYWLCAA